MMPPATAPTKCRVAEKHPGSDQDAPHRQDQRALADQRAQVRGLLLIALQKRRQGDLDAAHAVLDELIQHVVPEADVACLCAAGGDMTAMLIEHVDYLASRSIDRRRLPVRQLLPFALAMLRMVAKANGGEVPAPVELTSREVEILRMLATGASNECIGKHAHISPNTVKYHLKNIYSKLGAGSRLEAIQRARRIGVTTVE